MFFRMTNGHQITIKSYSIWRIIKIFVFSLVLLAISQTYTLAQEEDSGIAHRLEVSGDRVTPGMLVCTADVGLKACDVAYATSLYGVIVDQPMAAFEDINAKKTSYYVQNSGIVIVQASNINGEIKNGDLVTSSTQPGVAMKANEGGYVLGTALNRLLEPSDQIVVLLHIHPESRLANSRTNLLEVLQKGTQASVLEPIDSLRYLLAAVLVVISFTLGFVYFGRMTRASIEAIGRNPLAQKEIRLSVFVHLVVTFVVVLIGLGAAYLVLLL